MSPWPMALLGAALLAVSGWLLFLRHRQVQQRRYAAAFEIHSPDGIAAGLFVNLGGIDQWISIRGEKRDNPVILVLHGGPAQSYMGFTPVFQHWERDFTVVQWDRRGVGKTYGRNGRGGSGPMTLDRIADDGVELLAFLCGHLRQQRVFLLGHSMGSMIGITMAARRPDLLHAYIGTEQIIDMACNEAVSYRIILERLRVQGDVKRVRALEKLGPPPYKSARQWGTKQYAAEAADPAYGAMARRIQRMIRYSPGYRIKDLVDIVGGSLFCMHNLYSQWMAFDARKLGTHFETPIFIIQGASDVMTPTELADAWLTEIEAPSKELIRIEGAGHLVMATAPDAYLGHLLSRVRPSAP